MDDAILQIVPDGVVGEQISSKAEERFKKACMLSKRSRQTRQVGVDPMHGAKRGMQGQRRGMREVNLCTGCTPPIDVLAEFCRQHGVVLAERCEGARQRKLLTSGCA